jgi:biotin operon repressor
MSHLPPETKGYDPKIEQNDVIFESPTTKVEYDKGCWGFKYQVFGRLYPADPWVHVAEAATSEEAIEITKDRDRMTPGYISETEVERRRRLAAQAEPEAEPVAPPPTSKTLEEGLEDLAKQIDALQAEGIPIVEKPRKGKKP